jgi:hypothetical protein
MILDNVTCILFFILLILATVSPWVVEDALKSKHCTELQLYHPEVSVTFCNENNKKE